MTSLRKDWFEHVKKTRKKLSRKNAPCSHVEAMKKASETWPAIKQKILRKRKREAKKAPAVKKIKVEEPTEKDA